MVKKKRITVIAQYWLDKKAGKDLSKYEYKKK